MNLLEQAISCDDNDDVVNYCFPRKWPENREERARIIGYWLQSEACFLA
jgi:hypothetical protein